MCTFIRVECVAANALIELYGKGINKIGFKELAKYGLVVVEQYEVENYGEAVLIFNPDEIQGFVLNYSDYFKIEESDTGKSIVLRDNVDIQELKRQFRWTLSYAMLKVLNNIDIIDIIRVA